MSCPFLAAAAASGETDTGNPPAGSCPFAKRFGIASPRSDGQATQRDSALDAAAAAAAAAGGTSACPRNSAPDVAQEGRADNSGAADGRETAVKGGEKAGAGRCPFGFDSAAGGGMAAAVGPMSCVLCKALLFDPARCDPCNHVFCRECIARFADCPLCGADVKALLPDAPLTNAVEAFISAHVLARPAIGSVRLAATGADTREGGQEGKAAASAVAADASAPRAPELSGTDSAAAGDSSAATGAAAAAEKAAAEREAEAARVETDALDLDRASPGSFLFIQAMRAMQHGNLSSARARFALSASTLKTFLSSPSTAAFPAAAAAAAGSANGSSGGVAAEEGGGGGGARRMGAVSRLGAVLGSHADCCLLMSDVTSAASSYQEAIDVLSAALPPLGEAEGRKEVTGDGGEEHKSEGLGGGAPGDASAAAAAAAAAAVDDELCHALCVTLNKLGDLHYRANRLPQAIALYQRALALRQHVLAAAEKRGGGGGEVKETASKVLDVAVSTAKVADAEVTMGEGGRAKEGFMRAVSLVEGVKESLAAAASHNPGCLALLEKADATLSFLQQQLGATAAEAGAETAGQSARAEAKG